MMFRFPHQWSSASRHRNLEEEFEAGTLEGLTVFEWGNRRNSGILSSPRTRNGLRRGWTLIFNSFLL